MGRIRSITHIIGLEKKAERLSSGRISSKRSKVPCHCNKCNGKLILKRTKMLHEVENINDSKLSSKPLNEIRYAPNVQETLDNEIRYALNVQETLDTVPGDDKNIGEVEDSTITEVASVTLAGASATQAGEVVETSTIEYNENEYTFMPRRRARKYTSHSQDMPEHSVSEDMSDSGDTETPFGGDESNNETIADIFEDYSPPDFDPYQEEEETSIDDDFSWILLWIMNFRKKFNIPETATESLIKFMKLVLKEVSGDAFSDFPDSLYLAKKKLGLKDRFHSFVLCPTCSVGSGHYPQDFG